MSTKRIQILGGFPQSDWAQTDETKTDYIKNKITKVSELENDSLYVTEQVFDRTMEDLDAEIGQTYQPKTDNALATTNKTIVGAINEVNGKTVDKITHIDTFFDGTKELACYDDGIHWQDQIYFLGNDNLNSESIQDSDFKVPIVAGDNVTFTVDEENQVVKINTSESMIGAWVLNETLPIVENRTKLELNFECNGITYNYIDLQKLSVTDTENILVMLYEPSEENLMAYIAGWTVSYCRFIKILEEPSSEASAWIKTNAKRATPAIGVEQIFNIDTWYRGATSLSDDGDGISWDDGFAFIGQEGEIKTGEISQKVPITAGNNVTFTIDEENNAIAINATGGEIDTSNLVKKYVVELSGGETVVGIINKLVTTYPDYVLGEWSLVAFTGATTALYGLTINHYGGTRYNISGMDFGTYYTTANNVRDWSQVSVWAFSGYFQPPVPYCDESNNDQFLRVANGVPTWATVPNAEDNTF